MTALPRRFVGIGKFAGGRIVCGSLTALTVMVAPAVSTSPPSDPIRDVLKVALGQQYVA